MQHVGTYILDGAVNILSHALCKRRISCFLRYRMPTRLRFFMTVLSFVYITGPAHRRHALYVCARKCRAFKERNKFHLFKIANPVGLILIIKDVFQI